MPVFLPDLLFRLTPAVAEPVFPDFAAAIAPTAFAPGLVFGTGTMQPTDYLVALADGWMDPPPNLDFRRCSRRSSHAFRFHFVQYRAARPPTGRRAATTRPWSIGPTLNARSKFWGDDGRAAFRNWEEIGPAQSVGRAPGVDERFMLRELLRRVEMKVLLENRLDVVVRLHSSLPPGLIGLAGSPRRPGATPRGERRLDGPNGGLTEVLIPAGYVREIYDPVFVLSADKTRYIPSSPTTTRRRRFRRRGCPSRWCSAPTRARRT